MTKYLEKKLSILLSFPLWGRGLKLVFAEHIHISKNVVPLVGTWIETWLGHVL